MLEPDNDRLEEFFRKAAGKADMTFNEEDWKKLEARLDEREGATGGNKAVIKKTSAIVIGSVLLFTALLLLNMRYQIVGYSTGPSRSQIQGENRNSESSAAPINEQPGASSRNGNDGSVVGENSRSDKDLEHSRDRSVLPSREAEAVKDNIHLDESRVIENGNTEPRQAGENGEAAHGFVQGRSSNQNSVDLRDDAIPAKGVNNGRPSSAWKTRVDETVTNLDRKKIENQLIRITTAIASKRYEQKADVKLPGAEEVDTGKAETTVKEELASETGHVATPRLSLLLSFAPDFSSTSNQYSSPGKAYGAMLHYHLMRRWSVSAGVIKNNKIYTGAGEDYTPPKGYWKYYTNGIIPSSIDGACDILEFPVMIQYTIAHRGKNKWLAGAGASSYLMQSESYRYNFEEPNPGAKEGWDSNRSSRFLFNMVNFTVSYERQLWPGLMAGIEPYVKIPVEKIGWSNVRLFSAGASVTLRYKIIGRKNNSVPVRTRGPDQK